MLVLLSIIALASASACTPTYNLRTTAIINSGALVGTTTQVSTPSATAPVTVNKYLGVPFANKPGRFRLAEPVSPWTDFFDASKNGPGCHEAISEDAYCPLVYGQTNISAALELIVRITSDILMHCSHHVFSNETRSILGSPVWRFLFNASFPNAEFFPGAGAYHAMETQFFFGTYRQENTTDFQREVSRVMQKGYVDFAKYPTQGSGWAQVPEIGIFGDGVTPYISDEGRRAFLIVESEVLDRRCGLFL